MFMEVFDETTKSAKSCYKHLDNKVFTFPLTSKLTSIIYLRELNFGVMIMYYIILFVLLNEQYVN